MTAPLMPKATAVWLVENTTLTFKQIGDFCELHELEVQAIADGDVAFNIVGLNPVTGGQLTADEIARCEQDPSASLVGVEPERNVKAENSKNKKVLSPSQRSDKPAAILWILRNCPEIIDSQICKLIGTTKPTIASLRDGTHRDMANLRPKNPVAVGLCKEKDLDEAIAVSKKWTELKSQPKKTVKKKAGKSAAKAKAAAARKKEAEKLKAAARKGKRSGEEESRSSQKERGREEESCRRKGKRSGKEKSRCGEKEGSRPEKSRSGQAESSRKESCRQRKSRCQKSRGQRKEGCCQKKGKEKEQKGRSLKTKNLSAGRGFFVCRKPSDSLKVSFLLQISA